MPISFNRYVNITSAVGAGANVATVQLIGRLFTANALVPTQTVIQFTNAAEVLAYFGSASEEYLRAQQYFGWISKNITTPQAISYSRWTNAAVAPSITGGLLNGSLAAFNAVTSGGFTLQMGAFSFNITGLDFAAAGSFAAVATIIQSAIQAETGGGALWTGATVAYQTSPQAGFVLTGGVTGGTAVVVNVTAPPSGTDISGGNLLNWIGTPAIPTWPVGPVVSYGSAVETVTQTLTNSTATNNNFGTYLFLSNLSFTLTEYEQAAAWSSALGISYKLMVPVTLADYSAWQAALVGYEGVAMTFDPQIVGQYPEMMDMTIEAATSYDLPNSVQNYEFQIFPTISPSVTSDAQANLFDSLRINYYGQTQTAGQLLSFYQQGVLLGNTSSDPTDSNVYADAQWLQAAAGAALMTLLLALSNIPANAQGRTQILSVLQIVINQGLLNGVISTNGILSQAQRLYIAEVTSDPKAAYQVQNAGYWVNCVIVAVPQENGSTQYNANYILVYKKNDVIRKINGTHILI